MTSQKHNQGVSCQIRVISIIKSATPRKITKLVSAITSRSICACTGQWLVSEIKHMLTPTHQYVQQEIGLKSLQMCRSLTRTHTDKHAYMRNDWHSDTNDYMRIQTPPTCLAQREIIFIFGHQMVSVRWRQVERWRPLIQGTLIWYPKRQTHIH